MRLGQTDWAQIDCARPPKLFTCTYLYNLLVTYKVGTLVIIHFTDKKLRYKILHTLLKILVEEKDLNPNSSIPDSTVSHYLSV